MSSHLDYEINKELGECYLFMGDLEKAEEYYQKAASSNGVHPDPYLGLATVAIQRGDMDNAMAMYAKAADIECSDKAVAGMALVEMEKGMNEDALAHFEQALSMNPENVVAIYGLIQVAHACGRLEDALPYLNNCLAVNPHKDDVRFTLAGCLASLNREAEAVEHLEQLLERDPSNAAAEELLGQLTVRMS